MMMTMMIMMMMLQVLTAEICTPTYTTSCGPVSVKGTKLGEREQCVQIRSEGIKYKTAASENSILQPDSLCDWGGESGGGGVHCGV